MKIINTYTPEIANYGNNEQDTFRLVQYVLTQDSQGLYAVYMGLVVDKPQAAIWHEKGREYIAAHGTKMKEAAARCYFDFPENTYRN